MPTEYSTFLRRAFPGSYLKRFEGEQVQVANPSATPEALVSIIRSCDAVVSHRLHACIVAYSCGIPSIGLATNKKLNAFFDMSDRADYLLAPSETNPSRVADAISQALETPVDDARRQQLMDRVERDLDDLAAQLKAARRTSRPAYALA